jgi:hypothetical protein
MEKCEKSIETFENIGQFFTPPAHLIEICCRPQRHKGTKKNQPKFA